MALFSFADGKNFLLGFMKKYSYPDDAVKTLTEAFDIMGTDENYPRFCELIARYENGEDPNEYKALNEAESLYAGKVHRYTVHLLLLIFFSPRLKEILREKGLPEKVIDDTPEDLKWKMLECHNVHNVWGTFVGWWLLIAYKGGRYTFGRLQFEEAVSYVDYNKNGVSVKKDGLVIKVHIPSAGPLIPEDCVKAFDDAARYFKKDFSDGKVVFMCFSWLLYDKNSEFIPEHSNIHKFARLFDVVENREDPTYEDFWRIFYVPEYTGSLDGLPKETSLQKGVYSWLSKGNMLGFGTGFRVVDINI